VPLEEPVRPHGIPLLALAQQASKSDAALAREGAVALATAHGDTPRYGGKFLSAGNEEIPFYDMHQTSFGGVYAAVAPAYNCLIRTSPYDPLALDIIPEPDRRHMCVAPATSTCAQPITVVFYESPTI
jgi:hypothetical protein